MQNKTAAVSVVVTATTAATDAAVYLYAEKATE